MTTETTTTTTTKTLIDEIDRIYRNADYDNLAGIYTPDVVLDAHVPSWRFQLQGPEAIVSWWLEQVSHFEKFRVTWVRVTPADGGAVVEWEMRADVEGGEALCRQVDVLHGDGEKIDNHVIFCTGFWDPPTIARQKAEAPMVRW